LNIKWQLGLFLALIILGLTFLVFLQFRDNVWFLALAEGMIVLIIFVASYLFRRTFKPLEQIKTGSESLRHQDFTQKMRFTDSPEMNSLVSVYNQMIDNIRKERVFQKEQHYFFTLLVESIPVGIIILDYEARLSEFNPEARKMFGLESGNLGQHLDEVSPELGAVMASLTNRDNEVIHFRLGNHRYFRCGVNQFMHRGFPRKFLIIDDISSEVLDIEKKSYGKVIRMMAHEVNNSVGAINSILDSILQGTHMEEQELREYLSLIHDRNEGLNLFMKNFADVVRIPPPTTHRTHLNNLLRNVFLLMKNRILGQDITMELLLPDEEIYVHIDSEQIEQVLINIILNAIQAIEEAGKVTIELMKNPVVIRVADTGLGLSSEASDKIFTPFFSTRPAGQGVGLTMAREILNNHGFEYSLTSENGQTTFRIILEKTH